MTKELLFEEVSRACHIRPICLHRQVTKDLKLIEAITSNYELSVGEWQDLMDSWFRGKLIETSRRTRLF